MEEKLLKVIEKYRISMLTVDKQKDVREAALASDSLYHTRCLEKKLRKAQGDFRTLFCSANIHHGINSTGIPEMPQ